MWHLLRIMMALVALSVGANALGVCGKRDEVLKAITGKYQETGKAFGITGNVNLVEIYAKPGGTWTIIVTSPEGKTCIIAAGDSWEDLPPIKSAGSEL